MVQPLQHVGRFPVPMVRQRQATICQGLLYVLLGPIAQPQMFALPLPEPLADATGRDLRCAPTTGAASTFIGIPMALPSSVRAPGGRRLLRLVSTRPCREGVAGKGGNHGFHNHAQVRLTLCATRYSASVVTLTATTTPPAGVMGLRTTAVPEAAASLRHRGRWSRQNTPGLRH